MASKTPYALAPDKRLKKKMGYDVDLKQDVFSNDKIDACEAMLMEARAKFFEAIADDLLNIRTIIRDSTLFEANFSGVAEDLSHAVYNIKGHAEMLGLSFIATTCRHISDCCKAGLNVATALPVAINVQIIIRLSEILLRAFQDKIHDDGGPLGQELSGLMVQVSALQTRLVARPH